MPIILSASTKTRKRNKERQEKLYGTKDIQMIRRQLPTATLWTALLVSAIGEKLLCTLNHVLLFHSLNPGYAVVPSAGSAFPWKNRDVSSTLPKWKMLLRDFYYNQSPEAKLTIWGQIKLNIIRRDDMNND